MATNPKSSFILCKKDVILVKPKNPTPLEVLSLSTIDNDYNLELLCQTLYVYQANNTSSNGNNDPAAVIKEAISRVLVYYYPLAGKLKRGDDGKLRITCNGDGVPFLEAIVDCELSSVNYFEGVDVETAKRFVFDWESDSDDGYHPLVFQVTMFSCGGFTIGMGLSHSVCDGFGASQLFRAMAELASGKCDPTVKPVWERERLVGTVNLGNSVQFEVVSRLGGSCQTDITQMDQPRHATSRRGGLRHNGFHEVEQIDESKPAMLEKWKFCNVDTTEPHQKNLQYESMVELASEKSEPMIKPVWERKKLVEIDNQDLVQFESVSFSNDSCQTDINHMDQSLSATLRNGGLWHNGSHMVAQDGQSEPAMGENWQVRYVDTSEPQQRIFQSENKTSLVTSPFLPTTNLVHASFDIDNESIRRLKSSLINECEKHEIKIQSFTTLEVLGAYVWRSRFRALKQNLNGKTMLSLAMGIRHLIDPPLPNGYYGNAFVAAQTTILGKDLNDEPLSKVAMMIKESKKIASTHDHIQKSLNLLETMRQKKMKIESNNGASMVLTDWRQLGLLEEVDFGWKGSINVLPLPWNIFGYVDLCIFMSPSRINASNEGGVRVLVSFPREAMDKFKKEMDALKG